MTRTGAFIASLVFVCLFLAPAATGGSLEEAGITIDPIKDGIIWTEEIEVTGTAPPGQEFIVENYLRRGYCSDPAEELFINPRETRGMKGGGSGSVWGDEDSTWRFKAGLNDLPPGDYIFVVWLHGDEEGVRENMVVKNLRVTYSSADVTMIEAYEPGESGPLTGTGPGEGDEEGYYAQNTYTSPGSGMDLVFMPDLSETAGKMTKGNSLMIRGQGVFGKSLLFWISKKEIFGSDIYYKTVIHGTDGEGVINAPVLLLSPDETSELLSGQYEIFAVSGTDKELAEIEENMKTGMFPDDFLKWKEERNPYQQFVMLLEEPVIEFSGTGDGSLPDAVYGSTVNFTGTTNMKAGTKLVLRMEPSVKRNSENFTAEITEIRAEEGEEGEPNTWSVRYHTSSSGTGEYVATISDPEGFADASAKINIYDPAYSAADTGNDSLMIKSFRVDPETRDITDKNSLSGIEAVKNAVLVFETGLIVVIAVAAAVIYRKK